MWRSSRMLRSLLLLLSASLLLAQPRGSTYGRPGVGSTGAPPPHAVPAPPVSRPPSAPPVLLSMTPASGVREQGVLVTIRGAGFQRTRGLTVRFTTAAGASTVVPATYVDAGSVVCLAPAQSQAGQLYVTASNDGSVYSAAAVPSSRTTGTWLSYMVADARPWGQWSLANDTFPASGRSQLTVQLSGIMTDGTPSGGLFVDTGLAWCAFGTSLNSDFASFTQPKYLWSGASVNWTTAPTGTDTVLLVSGPGPAWASTVQTDQTYTVLLSSGGASFVWWRTPAAAPWPAVVPPVVPPEVPGGNGTVSATVPVELENGVFVSFATTTNKRGGDSWSWNALLSNPSRVAALDVPTPSLAVCPVPAYQPAQADLDPGAPGLQHELKISLSGPRGFSDVSFYTAQGGGATLVNVTGRTSAQPQQPVLPLTPLTLMHVDGYFTGDAAQMYEVWTVTANSTWGWRRYSPPDYTSCDLYTFSGTYNFSYASSRWVALDQGVSVRFELPGSKAAGYSWIFTALPIWSTPFSPVAQANVSSSATPPVRMLPGGALTKTAGSALLGMPSSWTYTVNVTSASAFVWSRVPYGGSTTPSFSGNGTVGGPASPAALDLGVTVAWSNASLTVGSSFTFTAFTGHSITYAALPGWGVGSAGDWSAAIAASPTQPRLCDASGNPLSLFFSGGSGVLFTFTVNSSGTGATWTASALDTPSYVDPSLAPFFASTTGTKIALSTSVPAALMAGAYVLWHNATSTANATYSLWASPVSSSLSAPVADPGVTTYATGLALQGTYTSGRDAVLELVFASSTKASWRIFPFPPQTLTLSATTSITALPLGSYGALATPSGLALSFPSTASSAVAAGDRYTFLLTTFVPQLDNVTSSHGGSRAQSAMGAATAGVLNQGSAVGVAIPFPTNTGNNTAITISGVSPTPGYTAAAGATASAGGGGVGSGGSGASTPTGFPDLNSATYPPLSVRIVGSPVVGAVTGPLPAELLINGTYTGTNSTVIAVKANTTSTYSWATFWPPGPIPSTVTWSSASAAPLSVSGLSLSFATSAGYPNGTTWQFLAQAGHTFQFRRDGGAWSSTRTIQRAGAPTELCCGISATFSALSGFTPGDSWQLLPLTISTSGVYGGSVDSIFTVTVATAGSSPGGGGAFTWSRDGGVASSPVAMQGIDFPIPSPFNSGTGLVAATGVWNGGQDGTLVLEAVTNTTLRWGLAPPLPFLASLLACNPGDPAYNAGLCPAAFVATGPLLNLTAWNNASSALPLSIAYSANTTVLVTNSSSGNFVAGDVFYIPVRAGSVAPLVEGVSVSWAAPKGYTPGDSWSFPVYGPQASRGPHDGRTRVLLSGSRFLPSDSLSCLFDDLPGFLPVLVPAQYLSPTSAQCLSPARAPDGLSLPTGPARAAGVSAPTLTVAGSYPGPRSVLYLLSVVSVASVPSFSVTVQDGSSISQALVLGTVAALANGVTWTPLPDGGGGGAGGLDAPGGPRGVYAQFQAPVSGNVTYVVGDAWSFWAYALASAEGGGGDSAPAVQEGSVKPGVLVRVAASSDGGAQWSDDASSLNGGAGLLRHLYSPVYVSPSGDDGPGGDGSRTAPYATLGRAVLASLGSPLAGVGGVAGLGGLSNWDEVVLLPGRYVGSANAGVGPAGRALRVVASQRGAAVIDCAGAAGGDVVQGDKWAAPGGAGAGSISLQGVATENCGGGPGASAGLAAAYPALQWWGAA